MTQNEREGKVVSFDQSGAFFYKRAKRMLEGEHMIEALSLMRKAVEKEPENTNFAMNLAEIYTEMDCFAESNQILFPLVHRRRDLTECYFGMGCNFFGMRDYEKARESLVAYITMDDSGQNYDEARGLLATISFYEHTGGRGGRITRLLSRAGQALDAGENQRAARLCEKALSHRPNLARARTMLSEAYIRLGKFDQSARNAAKVLVKSPGNIDALCHLAVCMAYKGMGDEAISYFQAACESCSAGAEGGFEDGAGEPNLSDLQKIGMTACMLNMHEQVYFIFRKLNKAIPYNKKILHFLALACSNTDRKAEAEACWAKALRLDPGNTIYSYYLAASRDGEGDNWQYDHQVPSAEIIKRIQLINETLEKGIESARDAWQNDQSFAALLKWGLSIREPSVRYTMLMVISSFGDAEAERALRLMLTSQTESDATKRDILVLLKKMNSKEPYIAYLNRNIVEVSVSMLESKHSIPPDYAKVVEEAVCALGDDAEADSLECVLKIWSRYCDLMHGRFPPIKKREPWVAALHFVYLLSIGKKPALKAFLKRYKLKPRNLTFHVMKILKAIG